MPPRGRKSMRGVKVTPARTSCSRKVTTATPPEINADPSDDEQTVQKRGKKQRRDCKIPDRAVEDNLVEFFCENELLWNSQKTEYRNKAKRQRILETKATELDIEVDHLWTWFKSIRDMYTRLDKKKSGDGQQQLTEREEWIKAKFVFFNRAVNHRSKPVRSLKAIIAQTQGDLDEVERAAAEERVDVDVIAEAVSVIEHRPDPTLSVSSDMETLQKKAKESGEMMAMLREQLPPPEAITERTTYAAYVKTVLQGLNVKEFRRARKGINKVLRPFCESDSTDNDNEDRPNTPSTQSYVTGKTTSSQQHVSKRRSQSQSECQSKHGGWQPPPSDWKSPPSQDVSVFNSADPAYMSLIQDM